MTGPLYKDNDAQDDGLARRSGRTASAAFDASATRSMRLGAARFTEGTSQSLQPSLPYGRLLRRARDGF